MFFTINSFAQQGLWNANGSQTVYTNRWVGVLTPNPTQPLDVAARSRFRGNLLADSSITALQNITANNIFALTQLNCLSLIATQKAQIGNILLSANQITSSTGTISFFNDNLNTTGTITADTINASGASISNLTAANIIATGIQTQTINTGELLINGLPPQIGDTLNVNVVNAGNIIIDGPATQIYSTNGVIDFNNNNIKNVSKLTVSQLGINTPNPIASMQVSGTDELNTTIGLIRYSDDDRSSRLSFVKYRGTMANPKSVLSGDRLGIISYHGFDGVQFQSSDMIKGVATENFNPTGRGSKIEFSTTPNGSTTDHIALIIDNDQTASFANTVYAPNIVISDKIITKEAEFDSLRINEKIYATGSLSTDTVHANKELTINNSLKITKEDINNYAEVSTKDTAVTLVLQKEEAAEVIIGRKDSVALPQPGQEKDKLTVVGNTRLQGDVNVSGAIAANDFSVTNTFSTQRVVTTRISSPDSIIAIGDSTIIVVQGINRIKADQNSSVKGIGIGFAATATGVNSTAIGRGKVYGDYSVAIGNYLEIPSGKTSSIVIGSGLTTIPLINDISNSLMIGFNSNLPTLVVTQASGIGTTGNVGIGVSDPEKKLVVDGTGRFINSGGLNPDSYIDIEFNSQHGIINSNKEIFLNWYSGKDVVVGGGIAPYWDMPDGGAFSTLHNTNLASINGKVVLFDNPNDHVSKFEITRSYNSFPEDRGIQIPESNISGAFNFYIKEGDPESGFYFMSKPAFGLVKCIMSLRDTGNVGIGIFNPQEKLHIKKDGIFALIRIESNVGIFNIGLGAANSSHNGVLDCQRDMYLNWNTGKNVIVGGGYNGINTGDFITLHNTFLATTTGNVIIGSNTPSGLNYKLEVIGTGHFCEVIVETDGWCDFVFNDEYKLMNLSDLDNFIKSNKHLPEIPRETEIIENGIKLGEMNTLLLKKIEELTLYIIQQNKQLEELKSEVDLIKNR